MLMRSGEEEGEEEENEYKVFQEKVVMMMMMTWFWWNRKKVCPKRFIAFLYFSFLFYIDMSPAIMIIIISSSFTKSSRLVCVGGNVTNFFHKLAKKLCNEMMETLLVLAFHFLKSKKMGNVSRSRTQNFHCY